MSRDFLQVRLNASKKHTHPFYAIDLCPVTNTFVKRSNWRSILQLIRLIANRSVICLNIKKHLREAEVVRSRIWQKFTNLQKVVRHPCINPFSSAYIRKEPFENNVPQCKIVKTLSISSSTEHNINKFRESEEKSVCTSDRAKNQY